MLQQSDDKSFRTSGKVFVDVVGSDTLGTLPVDTTYTFCLDLESDMVKI